MRVEQRNVYTFSELSDEAKERARKDWRETCMDYAWWEFVYLDAVAAGECLGIQIEQPRSVDKEGKVTTEGAKIFFSGFSQQGGGACFDSDYQFRNDWRRALDEYAPLDEKLFWIGEALENAQRNVFWSALASTHHTGRYSNKWSMRIDVFSEREIDGETKVSIADALRDFADWIYEQLEREYDYQLSDGYIDDTLAQSDYEFYEGGDRL